MSTIAGFKLVASKKNRALSPIQQRRNKLAAKIHEQWELCTARQAGETYAPRRLRTVTNKQTGERTTVETVKRVKEWFWISESGKINLSVRYGSKTLELAKGKSTIDVGTVAELVPVLETLKKCVDAGELDAQIEAASAAVRERFAH